MGILAIDFGLKRIGIAGSDDLGIASHPVKLLFNDSKEEYFDVDISPPTRSIYLYICIRKYCAFIIIQKYYFVNMF